MESINVHLSQQTYAKNLLIHLLHKTSFKITASILFGLILGILIAKLTQAYDVPYTSIITWFVLWLLYVTIIPFIIYKKASSIYKNTAFIKQAMEFQFTDDKIIWTTSIKTIEFPLSDIYRISTTVSSLIISFSPYQVIPIPYDSITLEQWYKITSIIKTHTPKLRTHYYKSYNAKKSQ